MRITDTGDYIMKFTFKMTYIVIIFCSLSTPAYAYLDPGTGSLIIQGIIGAIAVFSITLKLYWYKFMSFFKGSKGRDADATDQVNDED